MKTALITGASRGIGRAIAEVFVENGARVVLVARSEGVLDVAKELGRDAAIAICGDVTDDATVRECIKTCRGEFKGLDVLVNNAGAMPQAVLGMVPIAEARELMELNVTATINLTQFAVRAMKSGGSIVNLSSIAWNGIAGASVYSASKGGVVGFTRAAAKELAGRGIRVNALAPGFIDTDLTQSLPDEIRERTLLDIRMGRIGEPREVAQAALFLASDLASYVTGQVLGVDGGMRV